MQKYQLITENATDLITKHAPDGTITYASPVSQGMLGIAHNELIGHTLSEFVHPEDFGILGNGVAEAVQRKALPTIVYRARHIDQHYVWFETTLRLMKSAEGEDTQSLCISRDISDFETDGRAAARSRTDHLTMLPNRFCSTNALPTGS